MSTVTVPTLPTKKPRPEPVVKPAPSPSPFVDLSQAIRSAPGTPTWEMARFYPAQGNWTEEEYLALDTNHLIEFDHGVLEFLPMPTTSHSLLVRFLFRLLDEFVQHRKLGEALFAPCRVRISEATHREPDLLFVPKGGKLQKMHTEDAALVMEVVSEGTENRDRDLVKKRHDYAAAGIPEYWIVDPQTQSVTVLTLPEGGTDYAIHGEFKPGETASSVLLEGFTVDVTACFAAAEQAE